ncbi:MAG: mannose-1-phosphate guanylyltransferase/mannose-6-phosphate isomerase [Hyphomicrobium sp.]|nr:mannose-1-phosphate guanylyltransferase/mannose-6-phosphate isomerase [Hyphomicrobium sp.]PPD08066.1 MAG: mannose-1-phosphate guanylyltransferase/mannose-6-phosphate isomerase [Hyphomicrobium sp.]
MLSIVPVVLSGGSGTRLWPLSRSMFPKQFINFFNGNGTTLVGATLRRLTPEAGFSAPILLCNNDHRFLVKEELDRAGIQAKAIILEPVARNTAAAITVAALAAVRETPNAVLVIMPSDHAVKDEPRFVEAVRKAAEIAATGKLVLFGITPDSPHTGYGYIKRGASIPQSNGSAFTAERFCEKPDASTAASYLAEGDYFWNSGIFVLNAQTFLDEIAHLDPKILQAARGALANAAEDLGFLRLGRDQFAESPNISVDYAVMEKTTAAAMLPIDVGWNDVGSWTSLWEIAPKDAHGNHAQGDAVLEDTTGCYVHSERGLVATIGVQDLIIVDTPDALLVADKARAQDVGKIVATLKRTNRKEQEQHLRNYRPWGYFETLNIGPRFQVKLLHVKPGGKLSMQMHHHRSEHWIVVQGTAKVVIGETEQLVRENESVYIFATQWHRLENPGKVDLELIEVQIGTYLGEDDIIRTDDIYRRAPEETK